MENLMQFENKSDDEIREMITRRLEETGERERYFLI